MKAKEPNIVNGFNFDQLPISITYCGKVDEKEWAHFLWKVAITYPNGMWTFPYKCGLAHVERNKSVMRIGPKISKSSIAYAEWEKRAFSPKKPSVSDVMFSILSDSQAENQSFNDWCDEYGYSNDSMNAFKTYQACCEHAVFVRKAFTKEQITAMRAALEDY